jgi:hypothetical protein
MCAIKEFSTPVLNSSVINSLFALKKTVTALAKIHLLKFSWQYTYELLILQHILYLIKNERQHLQQLTNNVNMQYCNLLCRIIYIMIRYEMLMCQTLYSLQSTYISTIPSCTWIKYVSLHWAYNPIYVQKWERWCKWQTRAYLILCREQKVEVDER